MGGIRSSGIVELTFSETGNLPFEVLTSKDCFSGLRFSFAFKASRVRRESEHMDTSVVGDYDNPAIAANYQLLCFQSAMTLFVFEIGSKVCLFVFLAISEFFNLRVGNGT